MRMTRAGHERWEEHWDEARKAKDERRKSNRAKWSERRDWTDDNKVIAPAIALESTEETNTSGSLAELRKIMADVAAPLHRRIDAAETVISFELAPGAAADLEPDLVASVAYKFLQSVVASSQTPDALKFKSLRLLASVENQRAQLRSTSASLHAKRELLVGLCNAQRVQQLVGAKRWPPPTGAQWALTLADDIAWPEGWPGAWSWPLNTSLAAAFSKPSNAVRANFGAIRAKNRQDEFDRILAGENPVYSTADIVSA
jgi:hypothetical protein